MLASAVAVLVLCVTLYRSPLFTITRVEVVGAKRLSVARVEKLARVPADATLIRFPASEVAARVSTDPWVESVTVSRVFPDTMQIRIVERVPVALVDAGASFWLVDASGMFIAKRSPDETATLPVVREVPGLAPKGGVKTESEPLRNALAVLAGISPELRARVKSVTAPDVDETTLYTSDRVEIVIGRATELAKKDALARRILSELAGRVVSIDVRVTGRPTWRGLK